MNKKLIVIIAIVAVIAIAFVVFFFASKNNSATTTGNVGTTGTLPIITSSTPLAPTPTSTTLVLGTTQGSVTTTNFYKSAAYITQDQQTVVVSDQPSYTISYNVADSSFVISLLSTPLEDARQAAESAFLSALGISQQNACKLNVYEGVPISVSDQYPGESFPLSFCGGPTTL
jgi:hypothetical protein